MRGVWSERGRKTRRWHVDGTEAWRDPDWRRFTLKEGANGWLQWGTASSARYVLSRMFRYGQPVAEWREDGGVGKVAFTWEYEGPLTGEHKDESWAPEKGAAYTWEEFAGFYRQPGKTPGYDTWADEEKRIDPEDGYAYTWEEFRRYHTKTYTKRALADYWDNCQIAMPEATRQKASASKYSGSTERRIDPADGASHTYDEFRKLYGWTFRSQVIDAYWNGCIPAEEYYEGAKKAAKPKTSSKTLAVPTTGKTLAVPSKPQKGWTPALHAKGTPSASSQAQPAATSQDESKKSAASESADAETKKPDAPPGFEPSPQDESAEESSGESPLGPAAKALANLMNAPVDAPPGLLGAVQLQ